MHACLLEGNDAYTLLLRTRSSSDSTADRCIDYYALIAMGCCVSFLCRLVCAACGSCVRAACRRLCAACRSVRVACCSMRAACCMLQCACCSVRAACCSVRVACCSVRVACCIPLRPAVRSVCGLRPMAFRCFGSQEPFGRCTPPTPACNAITAHTNATRNIQTRSRAPRRAQRAPSSMPHAACARALAVAL